MVNADKLIEPEEMMRKKDVVKMLREMQVSAANCHCKVEWCKNFIKARFTKHHAFPGKNAGIEVGYFWKMAEASGLWERGTYGTPMSKALEELTKVESILDENGNYLYSVFRLA